MDQFGPYPGTLYLLFDFHVFGHFFGLFTILL